MKELFAMYPIAAWSLVSVMLALVIVVALWNKVKWWAHNTWYRFPLIGKLAGLSRDTSRIDEVTGFAKPERVLCEDYLRFMQVQDEHDFNERKTYLRKAGESSRKDMPGWMWLLVSVMVFIEAMGFSYVLAGFTIPGASENVQQYGAYGIAFLISVLLVAFTHWAGHELYVSGKINSARRDWDEDARDPKPNLVSEKITLDQNQSRDDGLPAYVQQMNRFASRRATYVVTAVTAVLVVLIAVGATYVRGQVLEKTTLQNTMQTSATPMASGDTFDMNKDLVVPDADAKSNADAEKLGRDQAVSADRRGGWGTFIVLAFIFVFLQIFGVLLGFKYGFAAEKSREAWRSTRRFERYSEARAFYDEIADIAQAVLDTLQQRRQRNGVTQGTTAQSKTKGTFRQYLAYKREERVGDRQHDRNMTQVHAGIERQAITPAAAPSAPMAAKAAVNSAPSLNDLDAASAHYRALDRDETRLAFVATLPDDVADALLQSELARKGDEAERKKADRLAKFKALQE
ncbi:hypothetical protein JHS3_18670 [Jeongeupia sp. HS-3]|uniref:hypothetical protein n=1 Tax=Jeongeupia sp. HS-3 TaxID=1009682 RepID=UPI0018A5A758|nr:hypothetical protein [Jeongeupia sp. HS-3]BCL76131.1 hypothetical protein JHS3_18670 [Jeongeupia sp. HS-3]